MTGVVFLCKSLGGGLPLRPEVLIPPEEHEVLESRYIAIPSLVRYKLNRGLNFVQ